MKTNLDYIRLDEGLELQPNGFLNVLANLTRTGVFTYFEKSPDGTIRVIRQLRHPEEVFAETTLQTLMGLPATNNHPEELVSPENANDLIVGMTSDTPKKISLDGDPEEYIQQGVTFFEPSAIKSIHDGSKRELSLGYTCELEDNQGEWNGVQYDFIQRDIKYNHLSLVDRARGGAQCKVLLDGKDVSEGLHVNCDGLSFIDDTDERKDMLKFIVDGKEIEVTEEVHAVLTRQLKDSKTAINDLASTKSIVDKLQAKVDAFEETQKKVTDEDDKKAFNAAVHARVTLVSKGQKVIGDSEDLSTLSDREIKEKVIKKINPDVILDGKSDDYVEARFDISVEGYKPQGNESKLAEKLRSNNDSGGEINLDEVRAKAWARDQELWKSKA